MTLTSSVPAALIALVKDGFAASLPEAATWVAISHPTMGTILVGMATPQCGRCCSKRSCNPPTPSAAGLQQAFAGELR
jgi:hypothetical protein